jgi:hypothetical protein
MSRNNKKKNIKDHNNKTDKSVLKKGRLSHTNMFYESFVICGEEKVRKIVGRGHG